MNKSKLNTKVMLFSILLLFILCLGCVSASNTDDNSTDEVLNTPSMDDVGTDYGVLTADNTDTVIGSSDTSNSSKSGSVDSKDILGSTNEEVLKDDEAGSFSELQYLIKVTENEFKLTKNYTYSAASDSSIRTTGITISKNNYILDGNGFTINGLETAYSFTITGNNVTLKNINIIRCGYLSWNGDLGHFINSNISDHTMGTISVGQSAGISWQANGGEIIGCNFKNLYSNRATSGNDGGLMLYFNGINLKVEDSTFTDSTSSGRMCLFIESSAAGLNQFNNCYFDNLRSGTNVNGGIVFVRGVEATFNNCSFNRCSACSATIFATGQVYVYNTNFTNTGVYNFGRIDEGTSAIAGSAYVENCNFIKKILIN